MIIVSALLSLLIPIGTLILIVLGVRHLMGRDTGSVLDGQAIRRFFQYALLLGLLFVSAGGLSTLLGTVLGGTELARFGGTELARGLTFTIIGIPLYLGVAAWSRARIRADSAELRSFGLASYVTIAAVVSLAVAMAGLYDLLAWMVGIDEYDGRSLARLLVWGSMWVAHLMVERRVVPPAHTRIHHLAGSAIGLGVLAVGLALLLTDALDALLGLAGTTLAGDDAGTFLRPAVLLVVGGLVWFAYWLRQAVNEERSALWVAYVLLVGVAGGLVTAIVAASTVIFDVLVWLVGDPRASTAASHFADVPAAAAGAFVGLVVWWYHHAVLDDSGPEVRTEVRRIYEYLMAGVGLLAAAGGLTTVLAAFIEALAGPSGVEAGLSAINTLLAAVTLLVVGGPVWWLFWREIRRSEVRDRQTEVSSPTRRVYLFVLFGLGGVAAVIALLAGVFVLLEDVIEGRLGAETLRGVRFAIGTLATAGAIAAYHWSVYRGDREQAAPAPHGPRYVLLVGPADSGIVEAVAGRTGGKVQHWTRQHDEGRPWSLDEVMETLSTTPAEDVIVVSRDRGLEAIAVDRG